MKDVLLLTACISPRGMESTALQNPDERKTQYIDALNWYLKHTRFDIVFCENTNTDIRTLFKNVEEAYRIEFLTFRGNAFDKSLGKGYGEAEIIKYAFENSVLLNKCDRILKVTGRIIVENIDNLVNKSQERDVVYADTLKVNGKMKCLSKFFICPKTTMNVFISLSPTINDSQYNYFEHVLYEAVQNWMSMDEHRKIKGFSSLIKTKGISGTSGKPLNTKRIDVTKFIHCALHNMGLYRNHKQKD